MVVLFSIYFGRGRKSDAGGDTRESGVAAMVDDVEFVSLQGEARALAHDLLCIALRYGFPGRRRQEFHGS